MFAAAAAIVIVTTVVVIGGGVLMRVIDHEEYRNVWVGMWWAAQTVTTVGYGDVTPKDTSGRIVAVLVMLQGVAFLTVFTAVITSIFVARAARDRMIDPEERREVHEILSRFDTIERKLDELTRAQGSPPEGSSG
jgi:voltage-gated potassium channel Kch